MFKVKSYHRVVDEEMFEGPENQVVDSASGGSEVLRHRLFCPVHYVLAVLP